MMTQPNIVFIHVDQWRGDCLSIDGHPVVHTPFLDRLALQGVRFSKAYVSVPSCIASRASLMTGLSPRNHGRVGYQDGVEWNYPVTLAGEFSRAGYRTHAIGKLHVWPVRNKIGFESVELHDGPLHIIPRYSRIHGTRHQDDYLTWLQKETGRPDADHFEHGVHCNSVVARPWPMEERLHPTNWLTTRSLAFLEEQHNDPQQRPFFLYLSYHRPHPPYDPPAWALEQYLQAEMPDVPVGDWVGEFDDIDDGVHPAAARAVYRPDILRRARAGYYGSMTHIDHQINRFLETLEEFPFAKNTWVVFTSDHGELMGDHHFFRKSRPYEGSARVPLIFTGPRDSGIAPGSVCPSVVEMRDIMPTLLEIAGLPVPGTLAGRSFLEHARGESQEPLRPWLHGEHAMGTRFGTPHWLTDGREKYVWFSGNSHEQLFDLIRDPQELHDLAPESPQRLEYWRRALATELAGREEGYVDEQGNLVAGRPL